MATYTPASPESRGAAERLLDMLLAQAGHLHHGRPGIVSQGTWSPCVLKRREDGRGDVLTPKRQRIGIYDGATGQVTSDAGVPLGRYQPPGLFPEAVVRVYRAVVEVAAMDAELVARLGSWAWAQEHRDLKVILAAWLLVQPRAGQPVVQHGQRLFDDVDFRAVGEAMLLLSRNDKRHFDPRMLLRVRDVLRLPEVAAINRAQGLGQGRHAFLGRWPHAVTAYLRAHERAPKRLDAAVRTGFRTWIIELAKAVGYRPETAAFFSTLRWPQRQAAGAHRTVGLGVEIAAAENWAALDERAICERIVEGRVPWKRVVSLVPPRVGITPAMVVATLASGGISNRELILLTPLLEDLGLVGGTVKPTDNPVCARWTEALAQADDQRARNVAKNARTDATREQLESAADTALTRTVERLMTHLHLRVIVDVSGSMHGSVPAAVEWTTRFLGGIPLTRMQVAVFNSWGRRMNIPHPSRAGVEAAFRGVSAGGGTTHAAGLATLDRPTEDWILVIIGDQEEAGSLAPFFVGPNPWPKPLAVAYVEVRKSYQAEARYAELTAANLAIPLIHLAAEQFADATDPYSMARLWQRLLAAPPSTVRLGAPGPRVSLIEQVLATALLQRPVWSRA